MSKSINQVMLMGNVGREPDIRTFDGGTKVAAFTLATSTGGYKKPDGTEVPEKTSWHSVVAWRGLAELAERYVHKGDKILVQGTISYREYEKDGAKRYITDILAYDFVLCGRNESSRPQITASDAPAREDFPPMANHDDDLPF